MTEPRPRHYVEELERQNAALRKRADRLEAALEEILKGEGAFSRDQLEHAINVIESVKGIARRALALERDEKEATSG